MSNEYFRVYFILKYEHRSKDSNVLVRFWYNEVKFRTYNPDLATVFTDPNVGMEQIAVHADGDSLQELVFELYDYHVEVRSYDTNTWMSVDIYQKINSLIKL